MPIETPGLILDKKTLDGKSFVQETSRPIGTTTYFTSRGDDVANPSDIGNGTALNIDHKIGDPTTQNIYTDFNCEANLTYIHEGYVMWEKADFDAISLTIVPRITTYDAGTNTNYNLYGGYLVIPAAGNGTITPTEIKLVEMPISRDKGIRSAAFWNATWNKVSKQFENIIPAPSGDGVYNMFTVEVSLSRFVNYFLLLNGGFMMLQTADADQIGSGMRLKLTLHTDGGTDHDWKAACGLTLNREKTC